jgi:hypothetical protein
MRFKWGIVFTVCVLFQLDLITQRGPTRRVGQRNLILYDKAGPYSINYDPPYKADQYLGEIRTFLWQHWKDRRLGLVNATFFSIEGDYTTSTFFVEPDAKGRWLVRIHSKSTAAALLPKRQKPRHENAREEYDRIDRVEATSANAPTPVSVPESESREPQMFRLRLRNSKTSLVKIL